MILDKLEPMTGSRGYKEYYMSSYAKDMNVNIGDYAVERVSLTQVKHYDRRKKHGKIVVYKSFSDDTIMTSFQDRLNGVDRKAQHDKIAKELKWFVAEQFGVDESDMKMRFDLKAGCSMCTCSPGWVVELPEQHPINPLTK